MKAKIAMWAMGLFLVFSLPLWAQPMAEPDFPDDESGSCMGPCKEIMEDLKLTPEQQKTFQEMRLKHQKEMLPLHTALQAKQLDLRGELMAESPNLGKVNSVVDEIGKARAEIQKKQIAHRLEMRSKLTPEQKAVWDAQKGKCMEGRMMHGGMRARHMGPMGHPGRPGRECCPPMHDKMD